MISPIKKGMEDEYKRLQTINTILSIISEESLSISQLSKRININRSTLRYYLGLLKEEGLLKYERQENSPGRPTLLKLNKEKAKEEWKKIRKRVKEQEKDRLESPFTKDIYELLKKEDISLDSNDVDKIKKKLGVDDVIKIYDVIYWMLSKRYVKIKYSLTDKGQRSLGEFFNNSEK